ncbi:hypothetical protein DPMN_161945 [Dreissena polymorpha]|uniref:Uncharacterized protein n=1 Tax=Dreissena polymorpha TaxID=45954 RepID=A0A9D4IRJ9_DREPO|nr:hypothetical protein DPMN_161945 [Dreissena polymorpha]
MLNRLYTYLNDEEDALSVRIDGATVHGCQRHVSVQAGLEKSTKRGLITPK